MSARSVIQRFGGIKPMSKKTGIPASTIQYWDQVDRIPEGRRLEVMQLAKEIGVEVQYADFVPAELREVPTST